MDINTGSKSRKIFSTNTIIRVVIGLIMLFAIIKGGYIRQVTIDGAINGAILGGLGFGAIAIYMRITSKSRMKKLVEGGLTNLMLAAANGELEKVTTLLNAGAEINAQTNKGATALHLAVTNNHPEVVRELMRNGADSSIQSHKGLTVLAIADNNKFDQIREIIENTKPT